MLLTSLQNFHNGAIREHKEHCHAHSEQQHESLRVHVSYLDQALVGALATIDTFNEYDFGLQFLGKMSGIFAERASGDENSLSGFFTSQGTCKVTYFPLTNRVFPPFRLEVNSVQAMTIFFYNPVNPATTYCFSGLSHLLP